MRRRVVITGAGCVSPLGNRVDDVWDRAARGESGVGPIGLFDARHFPVQIAAEVKHWNLSDFERGEFALGRFLAQPRQTQFAIAAALDAARSAGLVGHPFEPSRLGIYLGCGEIFPDFAATCQQMARPGSAAEPAHAATGADGRDEPGAPAGGAARPRRTAEPPADAARLEPGAAVGFIASLLNMQGPNANFTTACVSSNIALGEAAEVLRRGDADIMFTGGAHSMIHPYGIAGFHRLSTLSSVYDTPQSASRPFDRDRNGFVVGEGGVVLILEEYEHARRRGAKMWAEVKGWSSSHDAYRVTDLEPTARSAVRCIQHALADARLDGEAIDYINAHGSGTVLNDKVETAALKRAFGKRAYRIPISSTKSMTGHLTTACAAIETLLCLLALERGILPPTINYDHRDPDCDLDYIPNTAREVRCQTVLKNSVGFGGHNVAVVLARV
ncbi:MAG TPA: beta-ketoacyl-[acyl-carrier-protein] synthase family protein [Pirellulales bacterium]|jgi:3-oxoacyl-[acyl-carrier-protein] synthase II|nr:beta-ketoacyl-[acyl-carrier-protein] synthase family protein [Pirellulales bacterium]